MALPGQDEIGAIVQLPPDSAERVQAERELAARHIARRARDSSDEHRLLEHLGLSPCERRPAR